MCTWQGVKQISAVTLTILYASSHTKNSMLTQQQYCHSFNDWGCPLCVYSAATGINLPRLDQATPHYGGAWAAASTAIFTDIFKVNRPISAFTFQLDLAPSYYISCTPALTVESLQVYSRVAGDGQCGVRVMQGVACCMPLCRAVVAALKVTWQL